ncbi:uncharacterized protein LOC143893811 [Temnothorax americanus]|uniref:uncharacterized protein LOC143893811 n=1 Tax=Temnothorax americanus TaxID=1964332 RepID=UPI0040683D19
MEEQKKEIKMKKLIPDNQAGFRKGMGTMDQIFALNYLVNRQLGKKKGKMTVLLVDLKAAFDSVNKKVLNIEDYMKKGGWGGIRLRVEKIYTLMYADDIVLLAEEEQDMRSMISRLEGYLDRKGLTLSIEKTKIMRFRKGRGRKKKYDWRWKERKLEEVNEFKYLGYTLKKNGGQEAHI